MTDAWQLPLPDEARTRLLAEIVAAKVAAGLESVNSPISGKAQEDTSEDVEERIRAT